MARGESNQLAKGIFFSLFILAGLGVLFFSRFVPWQENNAARSWVSTPCTIIESDIDSHVDEYVSYRIKLRYRFIFEGNEIIGHRFDTAESWGKRSTQEAIQRRYPVGLQTSCLVNPAYPPDTILELTGVSWSQLVLPLVFVMVGAIGLLFQLSPSLITPKPHAIPRVRGEIFIIQHRGFVWLQVALGLFFGTVLGDLLILHWRLDNASIPTLWNLLMWFIWIAALWIGFFGIRELLRPRAVLFTDARGLWVRPTEARLAPCQIPWNAIKAIDLQTIKDEDGRDVYDIEVKLDDSAWQPPTWHHDASSFYLPTSMLSRPVRVIHGMLSQRWGQAVG